MGICIWNIKDINKPTAGSPTVTVFQLHIN